MDYLTISQTAEKWGLKGRRVTTLCAEGRIPGAKKFGNAWMIPEDAEKPNDARIKSGNYVGLSKGKSKNSDCRSENLTVPKNEI